MISYLTSVINDPWDYADIQKYELEGSQRDSIIYNAVYDSIITLTEENIYLCSVLNSRPQTRLHAGSSLLFHRTDDHVACHNKILRMEGCREIVAEQNLR